MKTFALVLGAAVTGVIASSASAGMIKTYKWEGSIAIPDNTPGSFVFAEIIVPADPGNNIIADIDVDLIIQHTWQGDLIVELEHVDNGIRVPLLYRPGDSDGSGFGFSADNLGNPATGVKFTLDDEAAAYYDILPPNGWGALNDPGIASVTGSWIPYGSLASGLNHTLSAFDGKDKAGTWRLHVSDNAAGDLGTILNFGLTITNVPAPGAAALLALAALGGQRRRRR